MVEIYLDPEGAWRFTVKGVNGEKMAASEPYVSEANAIRGYKDLRAVIEAGPPIRTIERS